jgi:hypothetical protein
MKNMTGRFAAAPAGSPANTQRRELMMHRFPNILVTVTGDCLAPGMLARAVVDGPDNDQDPLLKVLLGALACARSRVAIATPYFLPDARLVSALETAASRSTFSSRAATTTSWSSGPPRRRCAKCWRGSVGSGRRHRRSTTPR